MPENPHQRLVLSALNKAVVGNTVNAKAQIMLPAEGFHFRKEPDHMGRDPVHIERQTENRRLRVPELFQDTGVVRRCAQPFADLFPARKQALQKEEIR